MSQPSATMNLLVVDWDFFFPNPTLSANLGDDLMLYLWDHRESTSFLDPVIWANRAEAFLRNGVELPRAQAYEGFWDRFRFNPDGVSVLCEDSNLWAGKIMPSTLGLDEEYETADHWARVSLYDAHHDAGYKSTGSLDAWRKRDIVTCEDWMLVHAEAGSTLDVTYPAWRGEVGVVEPEPLVPVDRRVDDGTTPDIEYHAVFVCRSGTWVPPWCDDQFTDFLHAGPAYPTQLDPGWQHPRPDAVHQARQDMERADRANQLLAELGDPGARQALRLTNETETTA